MREDRMKKLNDATYVSGPILYWMDREQRIFDNWALIHAMQLARQHKALLGVVLMTNPKDMSARQWAFQTQGIKELEQRLKKKNIPFYYGISKHRKEDVLRFMTRVKAGAIVTDFQPLRDSQRDKAYVAKHARIPVEIVDAHNIVPVWAASDKQEYAARTIRPKIMNRLGDYLESFPPLHRMNRDWRAFPKTDWQKIRHVTAGHPASIVQTFKPGERAAKAALRSFITHRLPWYADKRNDPSLDHVSNLSPYFHFGMLAPQRAAMAVKEASAPSVDKDVFIEEAVVRRELSDNYCYYNTAYDAFEGFPSWAQKTLNAHRKDARPYRYARATFEYAKTHDEAWNAAQRQLVNTGKMHGYMRMYWAKKILEWSKDPEGAQRTAIYLNDVYELDGRDPNGYVGAAWSIGGLHDRPWGERPIFGMVRYMNSNGLARKFDMQLYIETHR